MYVYPDNPASAYLFELSSQLVGLSKALQAECEVKSPILMPRAGLSWTKDGWFRAVIWKCMDAAVFFRYVDHGTSDWVGDSMFVKEMPEAGSPCLLR